MSKRKSKKTEDGKPKKRKRGRRVRRMLFLVIVGTAAALAFSSELRDKALDKLFGAEEEFKYSPPSDAAAENGTPAGAS
jgi:hypothetical protein